LHGSESARRESPNPELREGPKTSSPLAIDVNLQAFSPVRGDSSQSAPKSIHLQAKLLRVRFLLPIGMETGQYTVRLLDDQGSAVVSTSVSAGRGDGGVASFSLDLDLSKTAPNSRLTMMIRAPGLSWRRYPAVVE
jgi:hypothetical protein